MLIMRPQKQVMHYKKAEWAQDEWGKKRKTFAPPISTPVYAWAPPTPDVEIRDLGTGVKRDLDLYAPEPFCSPGDKVVITGLEYVVIGWPEDYTNGPFGFTGGYRINLKRVEG